jgi:two-component system cell cycle sensor histidine kinase/response regulator CckA
MGENAKARKLTALVVDDDETIRHFVRTVLRWRGYRVLVAIHGEEASSVCERFRRPIDVMITDVMMPGMSGLDLADLSRQLRPAMPVLIMSGGYRERDIEVRQRLNRNTLYLAKPFTSQALLAKLEAMLAAPIGLAARN